MHTHNDVRERLSSVWLCFGATHHLYHPPGAPEHAKTQRLISEKAPHLEPLRSLTPLPAIPSSHYSPNFFFSCFIHYLTPLFCRLDSPERNSRKLICFIAAAAFCVYREGLALFQPANPQVFSGMDHWRIWGGGVMGTMTVILAWEHDSQLLLSGGEASQWVR